MYSTVEMLTRYLRSCSFLGQGADETRPHCPLQTTAQATQNDWATKLSGLVADNHGLQAQIETARSRLNAMNEEKEALARSNADSGAQIKEMQEQKLELELAQSRLQAQLGRIKEEIHREKGLHEQKLESARVQIERARSDLQCAREASEAATKTLEAVIIAHQSQLDTAEELTKKELGALRLTYKSAETEKNDSRDHMIAQISEFQSEADDARLKAGSIRLQLETLKNKEQAMERRLNDLLGKKRAYVQELAKRQALFCPTLDNVV